MKPRFEPDGNVALNRTPEATLVDPEAYDASEQQFAASLEPKSGHGRFVVDEPEELPTSSEAGNGLPHTASSGSTVPPNTPEEQSAIAACTAGSPVETTDSWRQEVQARITHYRARKRPRPPRYPSLQLQFDSSESSPWSNSAKGTQLAATVSPNREALAAQEIVSDSTPGAPDANPRGSSFAAEETGKLLEFPRVSPPVVLARDELAEPVFDQPRILEVPEVLPPPPALGGILIEAAEEPIGARRPGLELPLQGAPMSRRLVASAVDGLLVLVAAGVFGYIFLRITASVPALKQVAFISTGITAVFWTGYQYLLLVCTGTTPGLKLARLRLSRFDGSPVPRALRRWRVLASVLAGCSLALGYAWCFFDEDQLCWHDRITHTYMAPDNPK